MRLLAVYEIILILSIIIHSVSRHSVQAQEEEAHQFGPDVVSIETDHSPLSNLDKTFANVNETHQEKVEAGSENDEKSQGALNHR